jgi:hypothetical protein
MESINRGLEMATNFFVYLINLFKQSPWLFLLGLLFFRLGSSGGDLKIGKALGFKAK